MRYYLLILNIINALLFIWIIVVFNSIFDFSKVITNVEEELVFTDVLEASRNILSYALYLLLYSVGYMASLSAAGLFGAFPGFNSGFMFYFMGFFFKFFLDKWFVFPNGSAPDLNEIPALIGEEVLVFTTDLYLLVFQILFVIAIIYAVLSVIQNDPKYNLVTIGCLILMIVIPLMVLGFRDMLRLFTLQVPLFEELENPIDPKLTNLPLDDIFAFFSTPTALFAIICYIYLEIAFQINYTDTVTKPSLERKDRLEAQLEIIQRESLQIVANVEKVKEEAAKRKEEMGLEKESVSKFMTQTAQKVSYVKEMIEKRKLEDEEKKLITAASKTRRLGRYVERLLREDPEAEDTLTAKSSAPKPKSLATSTALNFAFRVGLLIIISFIIIHPYWFFVNVFNLPPAITESVAMYSPEVVITLMIPFILMFPVIAQIISYIKHRGLILRLQQEGRIKEILASVGDYVVVESEEEEEEEENQTPEAASEAA